MFEKATRCEVVQSAGDLRAAVLFFNADGVPAAPSVIFQSVVYAREFADAILEQNKARRSAEEAAARPLDGCESKAIEDAWQRGYAKGRQHDR